MLLLMRSSPQPPGPRTAPFRHLRLAKKAQKPTRLWTGQAVLSWMPCEQMLASVCLGREGEPCHPFPASCRRPPTPTPCGFSLYSWTSDSSWFLAQAVSSNFSLLVWVPVTLTSPFLWSGSFLHSFSCYRSLLWHKSGKLSAPAPKSGMNASPGQIWKQHQLP